MRLQAEIRRQVDRVLAWPPTGRLREILAIYDSSGGGLLAAGLAYSALFAILTALLFTVGIVGFFVNDPGTREAVVGWVTAQVPPLEPIVRDGLLKMAEHASAVSILGLVGLGWSASQFYGTVDAAFGRIFSKAPQRSFFVRLARGIISVLLIVLGVVGGVLVSDIQASIATQIPGGPDGDVSRAISAVGFPVLAALVVIAAVAAVYRIVPNTNVPIRVLLPPAILAGLALTILTEAFVFIAPRLVGSLEVFGGFAAVFAALAWLSLTFQVLIIGAVWTHERLGVPAEPALLLGRPAATTETSGGG